MADVFFGIFSLLVLLIFLVSMLAIIIGMFKPDWVLKFLKEEKRNRFKVLQVYGLTIIGIFILITVVRVPSDNNPEEHQDEANEPYEENERFMSYIGGGEADSDELQNMIDSGADVNYKYGETNQTPLEIVMTTDYADNYEVLGKVLIDNGADVNYRRNGNMNMLYYLVGSQVAEKHGKIKLLVENGIDIDNKTDDEKTVLMSAAENVDREDYELLLKLGADDKIENNQGQTAGDVLRENEERLANNEGKEDEIKAKLEANKAREKTEVNGSSGRGARIGMTAEEFTRTEWGKPEKVNRTSTATGVSEQWVYGDGNYAYFENGILRTIQN